MKAGGTGACRYRKDLGSSARQTEILDGDRPQCAKRERHPVIGNQANKGRALTRSWEIHAPWARAACWREKAPQNPPLTFHWRLGCGPRMTRLYLKSGGVHVPGAMHSSAAATPPTEKSAKQTTTTMDMDRAFT
jgi:hypothetical protein